MKGSQKVSFTVPAVNGNYAPEVLYLNAENVGTNVLFDRVAELTPLIETLPAGSQLEMDLLKVGGNPATSTDWLLAQKVWNTAGVQTPFALSEWLGVRLRMKSGGTGASSVVHCHWF